MVANTPTLAPYADLNRRANDRIATAEEARNANPA